MDNHINSLIGGAMKKLILILAVVFLATPLYAAPFLVSDPNPASEEVTVFKLSFDGGAAIDSVPVSNAVRHDLAGITSGSHTVTAQACNLWGCSVVSSPFVFNKIIPSAVGGMRIVP